VSQGGKKNLACGSKLLSPQRESFRSLSVGRTHESLLEVRLANPWSSWRDLISASESSGNSARGDSDCGSLNIQRWLVTQVVAVKSIREFISADFVLIDVPQLPRRSENKSCVRLAACIHRHSRADTASKLKSIKGLVPPSGIPCIV
jgi:hypothetical protein